MTKFKEVLAYYAQDVEYDCEFYTFDTEKARDRFVKKNVENCTFKCGRVVYDSYDGYEYETVDFYYG